MCVYGLADLFALLLYNNTISLKINKNNYFRINKNNVTHESPWCIRFQGKNDD